MISVSNDKNNITSITFIGNFESNFKIAIATISNGSISLISAVTSYALGRYGSHEKNITGLYQFSTCVRSISNCGSGLFGLARTFQQRNSLPIHQLAGGVASNVYKITMGGAYLANLIAPSKTAAVLVGTDLVISGVYQIAVGVKYAYRSGQSGRLSLIGAAACHMTLGVISLSLGSTGLERALDPKKIAVFLKTTHDYNDALSDFYDNPKTIGRLADTYHIYASEIKNPQDMCEILKEVSWEVGKPDLLVLGAHAGPYHLRFGLEDEDVLHRDKLEEVAGCINENLAKTAPIFLMSCSSGVELYNEENFAQRLTAVASRAVHAATQLMYEGECEILFDSNENPLFSCIHDQIFSIGEKLGPYIRVFSPAT